MPKKSKNKGRKSSGNLQRQRTNVPKPNWSLAAGTLRSAGQVVQRRCTLPSFTVSAAAYGVADTTMLSTLNEYTALSAAYQQYRFAAIKIHMISSAGTAAQGYYLVCSMRGSVIASSNNAMWSAERPRLFDAGSTSKSNPSYEIRPTAEGEAPWNSISTAVTANTPAYWGIKVYNGGSGAISVWAEVVLELLSNG